MQTIYPREKGKYLILIHSSWRTWVDSAYFSATAASTRSSVSSSGWAPWQWTWPTSSRTYSRSAMMTMNMMAFEKLFGDCYPQGGVKAAWKEFGYHHRILSGEQLVFTKKYEKIIWNVNTKWEHIVMGSFWFGDTHQRKYFQGVPLLVTIITATMDNFGSCESTLPNIGRYSCFIR